MDIASGIASLDAALKIAKGIREVEKAYDQVTLKGQVVDLMGALYDVKAQLIEARDEIAARDREIDNLKTKLKKRAALVESNGQTYEANQEGKPLGVPFCSACLAADGTQIRYNKAVADMWMCPRCKAVAKGLAVFR